MSVTIQPEISVLMPVRDAAEWLVEAVESIRAQTATAWELVAVDDGSRDDSARILSEQARRDPRIRVLTTSESARGIVSALNLALAVARGRYVARMDADDVSAPTRFAEQRARLDDDMSLVAVTCVAVGFPEIALGDGMRRYLDWQNALMGAAELRRDRFVEAPLLAPTLMIRKCFLRDTLGGWADNGWPEDWDLLLRFHELGGRVARVPGTLHRWRQHARQATRLDPRYHGDRLLAARAHYLAHFLAAGDVTAGRSVWLLGAGPVGKELAEALAREHFDIAGFAEVDPGKIGNHVQRAGRRWPVVSMEELLARGPTERYAVASVGRAGARQRIREAMTTAGWVEERDFIAAA
jgi:glycosyltransferase involved in cell wall biosynthesis